MGVTTHVCAGELHSTERPSGLKKSFVKPWLHMK